jgi:glycosyltransferase involved in cell wall biosynthesis
MAAPHYLIVPTGMNQSIRNLHIICFDVPYPVDYGGVFDPFYTIKSLNQAGVNIILHCFEYGRGHQPELEKYCSEVHYYERQNKLKALATNLPFIVASRANDKLLARLQQDNFPILAEGIHCTYYLQSGQIPTNRWFVRFHNVEYLYYHNLAQTTSSALDKMYFKRESKLLYRYESSLASSVTGWTMSEKDLKILVHDLGYKHIDNLPVYLPSYTPEWHGERGSYCLYHGNLSVPENEQAATWLLETVFTRLQIPFVVAGKNPSPTLVHLAHRQMHTCLVENPGEQEMQDLIKKAHVNILPSFNQTGVKLKLINALQVGRHCVANSSGVEGSGLEQCVTIADCAADMVTAVQKLYNEPFTRTQFDERSILLKQAFDNGRNARQMIRWIFDGEPSIPGRHMQQLQEASIA